LDKIKKINFGVRRHTEREERERKRKAERFHVQVQVQFHFHEPITDPLLCNFQLQPLRTLKQRIKYPHLVWLVKVETFSRAPVPALPCFILSATTLVVIFKDLIWVVDISM